LQLFEVETEVILSLIRMLLSEKFPIINTRALLEANLTEYNAFILFKHIDVPSPLVGFRNTLRLKTTDLQNHLENASPTN
jgi:hypothetical protein